MQKYKQVFIRQFDRTLEQWQASGKVVPESELYRLLHSIKGTAATIGLQEWTDRAAALLQHIDEESSAGWSYPDIMLRLAPVFELRTQAEASGAAQTEAKPNDGPVSKRYNEDAQSDAAEAPAPAKAFVLLVDDDLALLQLFKERMEAEGCLVLATPYPEKAIQWFYELKPDCVVLDVVLPGHSGYDLLTILQERSLQMIVPVILMSAQHDKDARLKAYTRGADDFLAKPVDPDEFAVRVMNKIRRKQSIGKFMMSDECTGLYNAVYLRAEWERYGRECARSGVSLYAALLDIDRFQELNDKFGHAGADSLLVQAASFLKVRLHHDELLIRWDKDQFLLLSKGMSAEEADTRFKQLSQTFAGHGFAIDGSPVIKTLCAVYEKWDVQKSIDLQTSRLSEAMKRAKRHGPGTVVEADGVSAQGTEMWRIAILDDDPIIRNMLQRRLKEWRLGGQSPEVRTFGDGSAFFEDDWHRQKGKYLLILDRMMPKINGIEVLTRLRADYPPDRYRIIMLTGVGEQEEIAQAMRLGTDDYVTKPFRLPELEARMMRILQGNKG